MLVYIAEIQKAILKYAHVVNMNYFISCTSLQPAHPCYFVHAHQLNSLQPQYIDIFHLVHSGTVNILIFLNLPDLVKSKDWVTSFVLNWILNVNLSHCPYIHDLYQILVYLRLLHMSFQSKNSLKVININASQFK